jgi:hypothetical protein
MQHQKFYPIGIPGIKWGESEQAQWLSAQTIQRSYEDDVVSQVEQLKTQFKVLQYGELDYAQRHTFEQQHAQNSYALFAITSLDWDENKPIALITGGVHGDETSGVQGALRFAQTKAADFEDEFNFIIVPCISPWAYETMNRWNPLTIDPNLSFVSDSPAPESANFMSFVEALNVLVHIDLHENTDSDNAEFRPALAARDGIETNHWHIPNGFYAVGDTQNPCAEFQAAIVSAVELVTPIGYCDEQGMITGSPMAQKGVINYPLKQSGLCASVTNAQFTSTTEVYSSSTKVDSENCILAQVAAICGGLNYIKAQY